MNAIDIWSTVSWEEDATSAFALSTYLHATAAAQRKLVGKNACVLEIGTDPDSQEWIRGATGASTPIIRGARPQNAQLEAHRSCSTTT